MPAARRALITGSSLLLLCLCVFGCAACRRSSAPVPSPAPAPGRLTPAEQTAIDRLPVRLQLEIGRDLRVLGLTITPDDKYTAWKMTLSSQVLTRRERVMSLWLHAYPAGGGEYLTLEHTESSQPGEVGHVVRDSFVSTVAGVFNVYVGEVRADGALGPALPLGWVIFGTPASPSFAAGLQTMVAKGATARARQLLRAMKDAAPTLPADWTRLATIVGDGPPRDFHGWLGRIVDVQSGAAPAAIQDSPPPATRDPLQRLAERILGAVNSAPSTAAGSAQPHAEVLRELPLRLSGEIVPGLEMLALATSPRRDGSQTLVYVFLRATAPIARVPSMWLHAYPLGDTAYEDWQTVAVPHPATLKPGHYAWAAFIAPRPGAYNLYVGSWGPGGSMGPAKPVDWVITGRPESAVYARSAKAIAASGAPQRAAELVDWGLRLRAASEPLKGVPAAASQTDHPAPNAAGRNR